MNNKFIKSKYDYWKDGNDWMLAIDNIQLDANKLTNKQYIHDEYVCKVLVFTNVNELLDFMVDKIRRLEARL